ncbi:MAG: hypothetical protein KDA28_00015, partial [Phycisphaerales bacterium]|nr:hypothetical protein [Phycisphaerales bacterium]
LHIDVIADTPSVELLRSSPEAKLDETDVAYKSSPTYGFSRLCVSPCGVDVVVEGDDFIVRGPGIPPSERFDLDRLAGRVTIRVRGGNPRYVASGIGVAVAGGGVGAIGALIAYIGYKSRTGPNAESATFARMGRFGLVMLAGGVVTALAVGLPLIYKGRTRVDVVGGGKVGKVSFDPARLMLRF